MAGNRIGDFSRFSFRTSKRYSGVQLQQGRVQLDSDWNEQAEIAAHQLRTRTRDLIGESGAPSSRPGFEIRPQYSLSFDGVDDYLQIGGPGVTTYGGAGGLTLEASVQPRGAGTLLIAVARNRELDTEWQVQFLIDVQEETGKVRLHRNDVRRPDLLSDGPIPKDRMTDLVVAVGDEGCALFFDGVVVASDDQGAGLPAGETVFLVGGGATPKRAHPFLSCLLSELSVSRGIYQGQEAGLGRQPLELLGQWRFERGSGDRVRDLSPHGNQALLGVGEDRPKWVLDTVKVGAGRYYVDGLLAELDREVDFEAQPDLPAAELGVNQSASGMYLFYLDVWERSISALEDPSLREPALGGADTTTRTQVVAQVKCRPLSEPDGLQGSDDVLDGWDDFVARQSRRGAIAVKRTEPSAITLGNHLYRIEIHSSGVALDGRDDDVPPEPASVDTGATPTYAGFKWSRMNASVCWPIQPVTDGVRVLELTDTSGHSLELEPDDWVELVDDGTALRGSDAQLYRVKQVDPVDGKIYLDRQTQGGVATDASLHPLVRRWDQRAKITADGIVPARSGAWTELEAGIHVQFQRGETYQAGDYWQVPARTATQDVDWPRDDDGPLFLPPDGVDHRHCPLAILAVDAGGFEIRDCRIVFRSLTSGRGSKHPGGEDKPEEIAGDLWVDGSLTAKKLAGELVSPDSVGTAALSDWSVTSAKLAPEIGTVVAGASILFPSAETYEGFEYTGAKLELAHAEPSWHSLPKESTTAAGRLHLAAADNRLYLLAESGEFWRFDPESKGWVKRAPLPAVTADFAMAACGGKIYVVGGKDTRGRLLASALEYDITDNVWSAVRDMPTPRSRFALAVENGQLYALGGLRKWLWSEVSTGRVEVYDPLSDTWRRGPSMPAPRHDLGAAGLASRIYALGGRREFLFGLAGSMVTGSHQVLNPIAGTWSRNNTDLPGARYQCSVETAGGRLYVVGGEAPLGSTSEVEAYDPSEDAWSRLDAQPEPTDVAAAAVSKGTLWLAGLAGSSDRRELLLQSCTVASTLYAHRKLPKEDIRVAEVVEE